MLSTAKALIFDMDGVLIDSEPLWRRAMIAGFNNIGLRFTEEDCRKTTGMRFKEVVELWFKHHLVTDTTPERLEKKILDDLVRLIQLEGNAIEGVMDIYRYAREKKLKVGLATSSSQILMDAVLKKLALENSFDAVVSAEKMTYGKPHPEVFLVCAALLDIHPYECLVVEDSVNGVIAAKAAQMKVFAIPDKEHMHMKQFAAADWHCASMKEVLRQFKDLMEAKTA
jgi:mannitol-1-/sugar-/sorbitol-6-/2-deoxyglucose-6-phosphatase